MYMYVYLYICIGLLVPHLEHGCFYELGGARYDKSPVICGLYWCHRGGMWRRVLVTANMSC